LVEWGVLVTRAELFKLLPFGLAATPASRAGGSTGYFGREIMLGIYIDGPSRAVRYLRRAARPGCPCPAASISSIKFRFVSDKKVGQYIALWHDQKEMDRLEERNRACALRGHPCSPLGLSHSC
jgi:hypothetical protein